MHLYRDDVSSSSSGLPLGRKTLVCVLGVPNHMTYADFCQFCDSFIQHMLEMRIVRYRNDGMEDKCSVLIRFGDQSSTDTFYKHFNGRRFSSLEVEACHVLFMVDVQYTGSIEHVQTSPASSTEQPTCPVCLERSDQDTSGILTTICNHSFHCSCISKWTDSSCPIFNEYSDLLTSQLENQKIFESILRQVEEETVREISEAVKKAISGSQKLQKMQAKLDKCVKEKKFLDVVSSFSAYEWINSNLLKKQEIWKAKMVEIEARFEREIASGNHRWLF